MNNSNFEWPYRLYSITGNIKTELYATEVEFQTFKESLENALWAVNIKPKLDYLVQRPTIMSGFHEDETLKTYSLADLQATFKPPVWRLDEDTSRRGTKEVELVDKYTDVLYPEYAGTWCLAYRTSAEVITIDGKKFPAHMLRCGNCKYYGILAFDRNGKALFFSYSD